MLGDHSENHRALENDAKSPLPVLRKWHSKAWMMHVCLHHSLLSFSPLLRPAAQKKKISFKILLLVDNTRGHPRALMEVSNELNVVFIPANMSILQSMNQKVISIFKSHYLRTTYCKAIIVKDDDSSDGSG